MSTLLPLVSCVMPTANRRRFVPHAIRYFQAQDYPNKELVVVDDGADSVADLIPDDPQIRYVRLTGKRTLGMKRNECVQQARGDLIMHWDDDDWMAPHRISYQVEALLQAQANVCGLQQMIYYELATGNTWFYNYTTSERPWLAGNSLLYTRDFWKRSPFPDIQVASDTRFILSQRLDQAVVLPDHAFYVAMIHPDNTSPKVCRGSYWSRWDGDLRAVMGADLDFYRSFAHLTARSTPEAPKIVPMSSKPVPHIHSVTTGPRTGVGGMRIGYVLNNYGVLSETFIRREILSLCRAGHHVYVYTMYHHHDPLVPEPPEPRLTIRHIPFMRDLAQLFRAVQADGVEHIHSSLMIAAHRAAYEAARALQIPFTLTAYSGHDIFTARDQNLYRTISADSLCAGIIVEDPFMRDWVVNRLGADAQKIAIIPNSFDTEVYRLREPRPVRDKIAILSIARFVEKKGLIHLVAAFNQLCSLRDDVELWLVGQGPEEAQLRRAAGQNSQIKFLGSVSEAKTRQLYAEADIFCLPCIQTSKGDADGVPTTVLEAMAFELPVVTSNLLSAPYYVRDQQEGLLAPPGNVQAITDALARLCAAPGLRREMGQAGRTRVVELCDLERNSATLRDLIISNRWQHWKKKLDALQAYRATYTPQQEDRYTAHRDRAMKFFKPNGRFLDIGCGQGKMRFHVGSRVEYVGCDPLLTEPIQAGFPFIVARGEALPFRSSSFDSALLYSVLINVFSVDAVLAEAARILMPGGRLLVRECVNDPNPMHLNHLTPDDLQHRVGDYATILGVEKEDNTALLLKAQKPGGPTAQVEPLVSVAITTYNRAPFIRTCIESALQQSYGAVEVVVVDDGSTDGTREILESFGSRIRIAYNEQNRGIAFSKNRALRMTSEQARYVAILDSDDYYHPQFVERCVRFLEQHPDVGFVYTDDELVDVHGHMIARRQAVEPWSVEEWLRTCNLRGDTWLVSRELVMQTALHDEALSHDVDYDLIYQLLEITRFAHLNEYLVYIRQHRGRTTSGNQLELAKCHAANLVKYGYSPEYAYHRARHHPEWIPAIVEGIELGKVLHERRAKVFDDITAPLAAPYAINRADQV